MPRILLVDDFESIRMVLADALEADGHTVTTAKNGADALAIFVNDPHDLVLTDMQMPFITGPQLIAEIQHRSPSTPIIGMSGAADPSRIELERHRLGIAAFFAKPMDLHELRRTVSTLTRAPNSIAQPAA
jgi:DNA-binding NtrC family response regulator